MSLRNTWQFPYGTIEVYNAAVKKLVHHKERLQFWQQKLLELDTQIRETGLVFEQSMQFDSYSNNTASPTQRMVPRVDPELQKQYDHATHRIAVHKEFIVDFTKWEAVLAKHNNQQVNLHSDDVEYFGLV